MGQYGNSNPINSFLRTVLQAEASWGGPRCTETAAVHAGQPIYLTIPKQDS